MVSSVRWYTKRTGHNRRRYPIETAWIIAAPNAACRALSTHSESNFAVKFIRRMT